MTAAAELTARLSGETEVSRPPRPSPIPICEMLSAGLTVRDIAELFGVHDRAIEAMVRGRG
jgi:plasmid maintenance system antidote protein VapI